MKKIDSQKQTKIELPPGRFTSEQIYQALKEGEAGDAALFVSLYKDTRLYDHAGTLEEEWHYWNDHYWRIDKKQETFTLVGELSKEYAEHQRREEVAIVEIKKDKTLPETQRVKKIKEIEGRIEALSKRISQLGSYQRRRNILRIACRGVNSLRFVDTWDEKTMLLGCRNGVVNLETGKLRPGRQNDYIRRIVPVLWNDNASCPVWERFLFETFNHDQGLVDFMQRLFGYAITGSQKENIFPILWGDRGRNGKTTMMETLKYVLGEMAFKIPTDIIMRKAKGNGETPEPTLLKLQGTRIVWTSEINSKDRLDAATIKALSGNDTIMARGAYAKVPTEFQPTHTLFTIVNPLPQVSADDDALWRRLILIPFNLSFVDNPVKDWERQRDPDLISKLKQEASGILKWLVAGALSWQEKGLQIPEELTLASQKYRHDEDILEYFFSDCCDVDTENDSLRVGFRPLYNAYKEWCADSGFRPQNQKHFREQLEKKFGEIRIIMGKRQFHGIRLLDMY